MKQSGDINPSEETGTGCPVTSKYGRTYPNKHGCVGRQQQVRPIIKQNRTTGSPLYCAIHQVLSCCTRCICVIYSCSFCVISQTN